MLVVQVGKIVDRVVEIDVVIVIAIEKRSDVITTAHRNRAPKQIRVFEVFIRSQKGAETCARSARSGPFAAVAANQW